MIKKKEDNKNKEIYSISSDDKEKFMIQSEDEVEYDTNKRKVIKENK